jgi:hypothetical protein
VWDSLRRAFTVSPRCCLSGTSAGRLPALHASLRHSRASSHGRFASRWRPAWPASSRSRSAAKKIGGAKSLLHTPRSGRPRLALLAALFLAALCGFLRHEFLLGTRLPSWFPVTEHYNRWAERTTLIQDVDYGREHRTVKHKVGTNVKNHVLQPEFRIELIGSVVVAR